MNQNNTRRGFTQISRLFSVPLAGKVREAGKGGLTWNTPPSALEDTSCAGEEVNRGFTLIELLVVVLIIGILAAVALPQYQKASIRSRNVGLKQLITTISRAEQAYYLEHGTYAANFNELDLDLPLQAVQTHRNQLYGVCGTRLLGTDSIRKGEDFYIALNSQDTSLSSMYVVAYYAKGPYQCNGFLASPVSLFCMERPKVYSGSVDPGGFCEKIERGTRIEPPANMEGVHPWFRMYSLP